MKVVERIKEPIYQEMELFEEKFTQSMYSKVALLNRITHLIVNRKGKQMRPMFVFLVAKMMNNGEVSERTYRGASVIELIHTATLVHDDIVDDSNRRRGFFSINALWKNKIAVLVGDYLLSKGLLLSIDNEDFDLLKLISIAVREMSEGELLQIEKARKLDITEDVYYEIIRQKTATLIAACCGIGAASVGANQDTIQQMRKFGQYIGMAFQIKDDLLDYQIDSHSGKPNFQDIKEKKITYPFYFAYTNACSKERRDLKDFLDCESINNEKLYELVSKLGGLEKTENLAISFLQKAEISAYSIKNKIVKDEMLNLLHKSLNRKK